MTNEESLHPDELLEVIDNMKETGLFEGSLFEGSLFEGTLTQEQCTTNEQVQTKESNDILSEKINALVAENEELLNDNVEKTETLNNLRNSITEIQRENQVIHTALYEEQEKNVNFEITIKTLTKMVK